MSSAMTDTTREAKTSRGAGVSDSIKLADLTYPMVRPLSLVTQRRFINHDFQTSSYSAGSVATCFISSGDDYVYGPGCRLRFNVVLAGNNNVVTGFGLNGSAINLIKNVEIYHSSGTQIDRVPNVNAYRAMKDRLTKSADYYNGEGSVYGMSWAADGKVADVTSYTLGDPAADGSGDGRTHTFSIPMSEIHDFWGQKKLIPAMLHSGIKVVIQFASIAEATATTTGALTALTITNASIQCDSLTLTDSAQLYLQEESARNGLVYPFLSYENITETGTANIQGNVFRAVSQATMAYAYGRVTTNLTDAAVDSFLPIAITTAPEAKTESKAFSVQWKLAGQYFPVKQLTDYKDLSAWNRDQVRGMDHTGASFRTTYADEYLPYSGIQAVRLERDHMLKLQGVPVSGSRALTYTSTWGVTTGKTVDIFMEFVKLAKIYMYDKCIIQE